MVEERKYEELKVDVKKLENRLNKITQKALKGEKKLAKYLKKTEEINCDRT